MLQQFQKAVNIPCAHKRFTYWIRLTFIGTRKEQSAPIISPEIISPSLKRSVYTIYYIILSHERNAHLGPIPATASPRHLLAPLESTHHTTRGNHNFYREAEAIKSNGDYAWVLRDVVPGPVDFSFRRPIPALMGTFMAPKWRFIRLLSGRYR